jgi:hypothetical protein
MTALLRLLSVILAVLAVAGCAEAPRSAADGARSDEPPRQQSRRFTGQSPSGLGP